ncbi:MAG: NAD(P)H-dependent oxidoreductase subunit E [Candidatus Eremiobacteraeota bacterium]|nr:NAD(P)H-dependent oxidoreductase subunit E [Candidatus Eremiobacteraeota bacterium]
MDIDKIIDENKGLKIPLIPVLLKIQEIEGFLSESTIRHVSRRLSIPLSQVFGVATFYSAFNLKPSGVNKICLCEGTACHVKGSTRIREKLERILGVKPGETTKDGIFTFTTINCMGACAMGPIMKIGTEYFGKMTPGKVDSIIKEYISP